LHSARAAKRTSFLAYCLSSLTLAFPTRKVIATKRTKTRLSKFSPFVFRTVLRGINMKIRDKRLPEKNHMLRKITTKLCGYCRVFCRLFYPSYTALFTIVFIILMCDSMCINCVIIKIYKKNIFMLIILYVIVFVLMRFTYLFLTLKKHFMQL